MEKVFYPASFDDSRQEARIFRASRAGRPLMVALHTWGGTVNQDCSGYLEACERLDFNLIYPEFRGPNRTVLACGSDAVVSDLADAARFAVGEFAADPDRVYLIGGSGGGHASLLLQRRHPELWAGVSSWCPIYDIAGWHAECLGSEKYCGYSQNIEAVLGGAPDTPERIADALRRGAKGWPAVTGVALDIYCGIHDGHTGSVPVRHAMRAFNSTAAERDRIPERVIEEIVATEKVPREFLAPDDTPELGGRKVWLRRISGNVRLTVFEGGHDIFYGAGADWLSRQKRGQAADWSDVAAAAERDDVGLRG